jgi:hypothetical protein
MIRACLFARDGIGQRRRGGKAVIAAMVTSLMLHSCLDRMSSEGNNKHRERLHQFRGNRGTLELWRHCAFPLSR